jgi:anaerobic selenocysteine-containing dehydrogenase
MAQQISGVHASDIERIAKEFAITRPSVAISGRGVSGHFNGVYNERCIFLLNIIIGNIDVPGGYCLSRAYRLEDSDLKTPSQKINIEESQITPQKFISLVKQGRLAPKMCFLYESNPAYTNPESDLTMEVLKNEKLIPYLVVADSYMTETASSADLILPVATYLESWGLDSSPALDLIPFVALQQPIVRPYANSVPLSDIFIELAHRIGGGLQRYFKFNSTEEYFKRVVSGVEKLDKAGGLKYLKENGVWLDSNAKPQYKSYESKGFNTPSGKMEIYSERLKQKGFQPHPIYESIPDHGDLKGKFVLVTFEPNVMGPRTGNFQWLAEIKHHNPIWMNRDVAKQLHIEEGDRIKISTKIGAFVTEARLTFGIHPRVIGIERNLGHWGYGQIARAKKFKSRDPNTELVWWEKEGNGISPNRIISGTSDPIGGGEAWNDTLVTISKA